VHMVQVVQALPHAQPSTQSTRKGGDRGLCCMPQRAIAGICDGVLAGVTFRRLGLGAACSCGGLSQVGALCAGLGLVMRHRSWHRWQSPRSFDSSGYGSGSCAGAGC
jgi:hypothetical protein